MPLISARKVCAHAFLINHHQPRLYGGKYVLALELVKTVGVFGSFLPASLPIQRFRFGFEWGLIPGKSVKSCSSRLPIHAFIGAMRLTNIPVMLIERVVGGSTSMVGKVTGAFLGRYGISNPGSRIKIDCGTTENFPSDSLTAACNICQIIRSSSNFISVFVGVC